MSSERTAERLQAYEDRTARLMVSLAIAFIAVYATEVLVVVMPGPLGLILEVVSALIWFTFAIDLTVRVYLAPERLSYVLRHPIDVIAVVVPAFRSLRLLRVFTAGQWLVRRGTRLALGRTAMAIALAAVVISFLGALAVLDAERGQPGSHIETLGDALWWSVVTMSTVGYGDVFPVTASGRLVGVAMMIVGVSMLGVTTATVAAWFIHQVQGEARDEQSQVLIELRALRAEVAELKNERTP